MTYHSENIKSLCDLLAAKDADLGKIVTDFGYPILLGRQPGFAALLRLILEQQVSLLSAKAAWQKLREKVTHIVPENILRLSDPELKECYFSRQKTVYVRALAQAVIDGRLRINEYTSLSDDDVKKELVQIKGIGEWTADNYLLLCLRRVDIFPAGDIALLNSIKKIKGLPANCGGGEIIKLAESWRPYRSVAVLLFWHAYLINRKIDISALMEQD